MITCHSLVLSGQTSTNPKQMSDLWIQKVEQKIRNDGQNDLADQIEYARLNGLLTKTVSAVKRTNPGYGNIITIKVDV